MHIIERKNANYEITEYGGHFEVSVIKSKETDGLPTCGSFFLFESIEDVKSFVEKNEKVLSVMQIITGFTQNMESYSYYGRNMGVSEDDYEEMASMIVEYFK